MMDIRKSGIKSTSPACIKTMEENRYAMPLLFLVHPIRDYILLKKLGITF
jgi:hypothetical protein